VIQQIAAGIFQSINLKSEIQGGGDTLPEKILIIDDDKSYCSLLHEMLLEVNSAFEIFEADTIENGREVIYREAPDVIFLDLQFDKKYKGSISLLEEISAPPPGFLKRQTAGRSSWMR
jgi:CheY-like chemotaxis protein